MLVPVPVAKNQILLAAEDRVRMTRLYEEVFTRLEEMAMITARAIRLDARAAFAVKFNPVAGQHGREFAAVEIVSTADRIGYYDYREGTCFGAQIPQASRTH
jgi:hypothetical protein